jgi:hypothetical protein
MQIRSDYLIRHLFFRIALFMGFFSNFRIVFFTGLREYLFY